MPNISRTKTWNANETLTAADLNAEFDGILTGVNDNALNNDNLNQTDDYLFWGRVLLLLLVMASCMSMSLLLDQSPPMPTATTLSSRAQPILGCRSFQGPLRQILSILEM